MKPVISFVLVPKPVRPSLHKIVECLLKNWPIRSACILEPPPIQEFLRDETLNLEAFEFDGVTAAILVDEHPFPEDDLELPCEAAWYWPECREAVKAHQANIAVALPEPPSDPLERQIRLTQATAAVAEVAEAIAVFWPSSILIHRAEDFIDAARQMGPGQFPLELWVAFHGQIEDDQTLTFFTRGMRAFSLPEIEVYNSRRDPQFVYERVYNIAYYLLENGPVIHDGEMVGMSEEERYEVKVRHSRLEPRLKTLQIEM